MDLSRLEFDTLEPKVVGPFKLAGQTCYIFEGTAATVAAHSNRKLGQAKLDDEGNVSLLGTLGGLPRYTVHLHLIRCETPPTCFEEAVVEPLRFPEHVIEGWRDRIVDMLFEECVEITPALRPSADLEDMTRQRDKLNRRIAELEEKRGDPKGSPDAGSGNSSTPQS